MPNKYQMLQELQDNFGTEVWAMLGAGFRVMPESMLYLMANNKDLILQAVQNPLADTLAVFETSITLANIEFVTKSLYQKVNGSADYTIIYFYPEPMGEYKMRRPKSNYRWMLVAVPKLGDHKDNLPILEREIKRYLEKACIMVAHD